MISGSQKWPQTRQTIAVAGLTMHDCSCDLREIRMLQRLDFEPVFFAPFVSSAMTVEPSWIDYNGHLNMAYYNVLIDRSVDEAFALVGLGPEYVKERGHSFFTAECHVRYLRELQAGQSVRTTIRLIDYDEKRIHFFAELYHAVEGWMSATSEQMALHVNMDTKKVVALPDDVLDRLAAMKAAHAALPAPEGIGRKIGMAKRS